MHSLSELTGEARQAAYLLANGWELHVNENKKIPPCLIKVKTRGNSCTTDTQKVEVDTVIDLNQCGVLAKRTSYWFEDNAIHIYEYCLSDI